jgi:hypothetical protein
MYNSSTKVEYATDITLGRIVRFKNWDGAQSKTRPSNLPDINLNQTELTRDILCL